MKFFFVVIAIVICHFEVKAKHKLNWEHFRGTIYLQNNDSLNGEILLYTLDNGILIAKDYMGFVPKLNSQSYNADSVKWIKFNRIKRVTITLPEPISTITYEYLSYGKTLWRLLRKNDSVAIYSDIIIPRWRLQFAPKRIILQSKKDTLKMYSGWSWFFHDSRTEPLLRNFINKRYNTSFKKNDFKDEDEELNYIAAHG